MHKFYVFGLLFLFQGVLGQAALLIFEDTCVRDSNTFLNSLALAPNHRNISVALQPPNQDDTLYMIVHIYIQVNESIPQSYIGKWVWAESCLYTAVDLDLFPKLSLGCIYPGRRKTELVVTIPPFCSGIDQDEAEKIQQDGLYLLQTLERSSVISTTVTNYAAECVCKCEFKEHVFQSTGEPERQTFEELVLLSSLVGLLTLVCAFMIVFVKLRGKGMNYKNEQLVRDWSLLTGNPLFWAGGLGAILTFLLIFSLGLLLGQETSFIDGGGVGLSIISAIIFVPWFYFYILLAIRNKMISWKFFSYSGKSILFSVNGWFLILTSLWTAVFAAILIMQILWALLGAFLDPTWAIPLLSVYISFALHAFFWLDRIYYSTTAFKKVAVKIVFPKVLRRNLSAAMKEHRKDAPKILAYFLNHSRHLSTLGISVKNKAELSDAIKKIQEAVENNNKDQYIWEQLFDSAAAQIQVDSTKVNNNSIAHFLFTEQRLSFDPQREINLLNEEFLTNVWNKNRNLISEIRKKLGIPPWEITILGVISSLIFILSIVFIWWGFQSITNSAIGLAVFQSVLLALLALGSKAVADLKDAENYLSGISSVEEGVAQFADSMLLDETSISEMAELELQAKEVHNEEKGDKKLKKRSKEKEETKEETKEEKEDTEEKKEEVKEKKKKKKPSKQSDEEDEN